MYPTGKDSFKILAPVALDSVNEEEILLSLHHLLKALQGERSLRLYHVISPDRIRLAPLRGESFLHQLEIATRQAQEKLQVYVSTLREKVPPEVNIEYHIESHEVAAPAEEIEAHLQSESFSLLVVVFKQRKRWERFFGTTALWDLVENTTIPLLLLPAPFSISPRRILWLSSMETENFSFLAPLVSFIRRLKGTLYCAKISTPSHFTTHRTFQRQVLEMCDYIIEHIDPDFVPEECILYADKDLSEGALHVAQDFLMDITALSAEEALNEWKAIDRLLSHQMPVLLLRSASHH
ncbi:MAG: universal stress protein [Bacteroidia bacterium]|nr:universal stress protein [Bacteroidia bacterium]MDW8015612.1 universal stress protein [Bacteroidia bacterium]